MLYFDYFFATCISVQIMLFLLLCVVFFPIKTFPVLNTIKKKNHFSFVDVEMGMLSLVQ